MKIKAIVGAVILFFVSTVFLGTVYAADIVSRTGAIKITRPDGTVLTVEKDEPLPDIPSGSFVEVLSGSIKVSPAAGFIQIIAGDSVAVVEAGDVVTVGVDSRTGMADFEVQEGQINVVTGNTTSVINRGQRAQIDLDKRTGTVEVRSIKGTIDTVTVGVQASIPQGAVAKISADAKTRKIHVEAVEGAIIVTSIDGTLMEVSEGQSIDTPGSAIGEIQTFAEEVTPFPAEEPAEPELPEATPHRP